MNRPPTCLSGDLTPAQVKMLARVPDEMTRFMFGKHGVRSLLGNQTLRVLKELGLIEIATGPGRWGKTAAGRALSSQHRGET